MLHMTLMPMTRPSTEIVALVNPQVLLSLAAGAIGFGGMFCVYTYISWTMTERAGFPEELMWFVLMVYGVGMVVGNWIGGRFADINVDATVAGSLVTMVVMLVLLSVGGVVIDAGFNYSYPALAGAVLAIGGLVVFVPAVLLRRRQVARAASVRVMS